jgi:hypothetical protein
MKICLVVTNCNAHKDPHMSHGRISVACIFSAGRKVGYQIMRGGTLIEYGYNLQLTVDRYHEKQLLGFLAN